MSDAARVLLPGPADTERHAAGFARALHRLPGDTHLVIALQGELGAGKTSWVRALLRSLGWPGPVRSPTYTLVEPYELDGRRFLHMDLYRLADPVELEYLGVRDQDAPGTVWLVEWPERAGGELPRADVTLTFRHCDGGRELIVQTAGAVGSRLAGSAENPPGP
ncbi:MAG TPA: tRNA (adenosine(37)-N6)-threonylcarbamoyltransferase complex ATPase subunit type 1 TsaE [Gammaproteobacteria bacterium]|nr:tRNA (adenosine(37)-N6)-threonylcarbamoyltransferase complex ATPase subunit type 1 TsaE [Gammaproteobacteria bacterium]